MPRTGRLQASYKQVEKHRPWSAVGGPGQAFVAGKTFLQPQLQGAVGLWCLIHKSKEKGWETEFCKVFW